MTPGALRQAWSARACARKPTARETQTLCRTRSTSCAHEFAQAQPKKPKSLLAVGESTRDEKLPAAEHAAWTTPLPDDLEPGRSADEGVTVT